MISLLDKYRMLEETPHSAYEQENWVCYDCDISLNSDGMCYSCGQVKAER